MLGNLYFQILERGWICDSEKRAITEQIKWREFANKNS